MSEQNLIWESAIQPDEAILAEIQQLQDAVEQVEHAKAMLTLEETVCAFSDMHTVWWVRDSENLLGVATVFVPTPEEGEISVCVHPSLRRQGIGTLLVHKVVQALHVVGVKRMLLVCDCASTSGINFVRSLGAAKEFSEFTMQWAKDDVKDFSLADFSVRRATAADIPAITQICADAYSDDHIHTEAFIETSFYAVDRTAYIGMLSGIPVCSCFIHDRSSFTSLHMVAVKQDFQGKGIGAACLSMVLNLPEIQNRTVQLEVNSSNKRAFRLYEKLGFVIENEIAYFLLNSE